MINHGPDELLEGDYVLILESISSFPLYYPYGLAVGDTVTIPVFSFINSSEEDEVYEACVWIQFYEEYHENNFILIDSNQTNDTVCFSVIMEGENTNSIKENNASAAFIIYPNPIKAQQSLFVRPQDDQGAMPKYVRIINVLGQEVFQSTMKNGGGMLTIDLPVLNVGIYSLELIDDKGKILHRQSIQIE